ncbi:MAG: excinuclease ABC subunit UvrA, partial [Chitinivibrionales bacterium]|nr:excinuclease ABC subunit UvrA [Chitinivibrionales bacterium]
MSAIRIIGCRQNNLKNISVDLPLNSLVVVTGLSGSGKSSLAFDTLYAEGQRRYVETFSSYARQFLERMDKPHVEAIESIPAAIAIDQTNPVRTSRSTVGTMTELTDHLKLLYSRAAQLYCQKCGKAVHQDCPETIWHHLCTEGIIAEKYASASDQKPRLAVITFTIATPQSFSDEEITQFLLKQGYVNIYRKEANLIEVIQDRVELCTRNRKRIVEDFEAAVRYGHGTLAIHLYETYDKTRKPLQTLTFSSRRCCPSCGIEYAEPTPNLFSFNSPLGACPTCRGFGRTIGIDYGLVIADETRSLQQGAIKIWQTKSFKECQDDLIRYSKKRSIPTDVAWCDLTPEQKTWVIEGEGSWDDQVWYGVKRFFDWLESRTYKMHVRVLLSRYRSYAVCPECKGTRLKPAALLWRLGTGRGLSIAELMGHSISDCAAFFQTLTLRPGLATAVQQLLSEIRIRLSYLIDVGVGYLTLDRQSRTLSGGEVQRINLTTALATSLVNTLFVLDEPSIGLHCRDVKRLITILRRLRDCGNTLVVVEHDPEVIRAADYILELGPGPGDRGGEIVFFGTYERFLTSSRSLTAQYIRGEKVVAAVSGLSDSLSPVRPPLQATMPQPRAIEIIGASAHNLKDVRVQIPLGKLVCVTGVSGSGKSTLIESVLYQGLCKIKKKSGQQPGASMQIVGHELIDDVVMVDQSAIGKTSRSNPVSYVGAFDEIRKLFSRQALSLDRGYSGSTFSFNSGTGRCPTCLGSGFKHVEMQFLSDVYLRCSDCDGTRFKKEVLEITVQGLSYVSEQSGKDMRHSIAEVLALTVDQAQLFFAGHPAITGRLSVLSRVGLGYLRLGQPVPTLSGGEAQRLKLAGHLVEKNKGRLLFLFDEPSTGLHFQDVAVLLGALRQLLDYGHSIVVIEHQLDIIRCSDWIIDLGPEAGADGGRIICCGTPHEIMQHPHSHTGRSLAEDRAVKARQHLQRDIGRASHFARLEAADAAAFGHPPAVLPPVKTASASVMSRLPEGDNAIIIQNARHHNLKNISCRIPRDCLTVLTGVSGSGKSTIAFDILFAEGQRRYLESLNAYARTVISPPVRPDIDGISGIPPTVAIEQRLSRGGRKSTVATVTEIYHYLRLLFVKLGTQHCPACGGAIEPQKAGDIVRRVQRSFGATTIGLMAPLVTDRKGYYTEIAAWAAKHGYPFLWVDGKQVSTDTWPRLDRFREHTIELPIGSVAVSGRTSGRLKALVDEALERGNGFFSVMPVDKKLSATGKPTVFSTVRACAHCGVSYPEPDPRLFSFNSKHGWCPACFGTGLQLQGFDEEQTGEEPVWNQWYEGGESICPVCKGKRLNAMALAMEFRGKSISHYTALSVTEAVHFFKKLTLRSAEQEIGRDCIEAIRSRLQFMQEVGLGYLTLDRSAPTLSGGEAQRVRLASQLGSNLRGVCFILDEPTIGLHNRDTQRLLGILKALVERGNTVVVVEHDEETILSADHIIDLGPGGGEHGGTIVGQGTVAQIRANPGSVTGVCLNKRFPEGLLMEGGTSVVAKKKRKTSGMETREQKKSVNELVVANATLHNLKTVTVSIPLGKLVCVTGVSGSGKSTLVRDIVFSNVESALNRRKNHDAPLSACRHRRSQWIGCEQITGIDCIKRVLEVDQQPIGRTPRSSPATYIGLWDDIRKLFAATPD